MELDVAGTPEYWPPEFARADLSGEDTISGSGRAVDLWGLGALLFVGLTGRSPIVDKPDRTASAATPGPNRALSEEDDAFSRAIVEYADGARQLWTPADCDTISPEARRLVERLLEPNPEDRLGCRSSGLGGPRVRKIVVVDLALRARLRQPAATPSRVPPLAPAARQLLTLECAPIPVCADPP